MMGALAAVEATERLAEAIVVEGVGEGHDLILDAEDVTDRFAWSAAFDRGNSSVDGGRNYEVERRVQGRLLHDIFGNPCRPVSYDAAHRTPSVASLAKVAYDERQLPSGELDPHRLAILADALEEAGAPDELVTHLRSPGTHVRGCFAVDVALGLS